MPRRCILAKSLVVALVAISLGAQGKPALLNGPAPLGDFYFSIRPLSGWGLLPSAELERRPPNDFAAYMYMPPFTLSTCPVM